MYCTYRHRHTGGQVPRRYAKLLPTVQKYIRRTFLFHAVFVSPTVVYANLKCVTGECDTLTPGVAVGFLFSIQYQPDR